MASVIDTCRGMAGSGVSEARSTVSIPGRVFNHIIGVRRSCAYVLRSMNRVVPLIVFGSRLAGRYSNVAIPRSKALPRITSPRGKR